MNGQELVARLIDDIEKSVEGRHKISDYDEIKNCVDSVRNFLNSGSVFQKFSIAHTYDCQLRFDAMKLAFFLGTNPHIKDAVAYNPGDYVDMTLLLDILKQEKYDVARRFDIFKACAEIDKVLAYRFSGLVYVLDHIHDMAGTISASVKVLD